MTKKSLSLLSQFDEQQLFPDAEYDRGRPLKLKPLDDGKRIWTQHKALLVALYLKFFLFITRHGTYIDVFAGPQNDDDGGWAAELVLNLEPAWLRHFHFFERDTTSHKALVELAVRHPSRDVDVGQPGDSNIELPARIPAGSIRAREATFCLLDQRTFECGWNLCQHVAQLKPDGELKVEQFYFLAEGWLNRAFAATSTEDGRSAIAKWWGSGDWEVLREMRGWERAELLCGRFKNELGYKHAIAWPIYKKEERSGPVMYFMIHATDHDEAPALMRRAYDKVLVVPASLDQLELDFGDDLSQFQGLADAFSPDDAEDPA